MNSVRCHNRHFQQGLGSTVRRQTDLQSLDRRGVCGVIHKSPGRPRLEGSSCVGSEQSALTEGDECAGQNEPWSRHVVKEQRLLRGMDAPPTLGSENL